MARRPRPSLATLYPTTGPAVAEAAHEPSAARPAPGSSGPVQVEINGAGWREVSGLARRLGVPAEMLAEEALNDALARHHRPPVVRCERPESSGAAIARAAEVAILGATWPARYCSRMWYQGVTAPALAAWETWAALVEAGAPARPGADRAGGR